jgi:hypothetical protein
MKHTLDADQEKQKQALIRSAKQAFSGDPKLLDEYTNEDWRLARVDANVKTLMEGDITIARKSERPETIIPRVYAYCWRTKTQITLHTTDPIEFLED